MIALVIGHSEEKQGAWNSTHRLSEFQFNSTLARLIKLFWRRKDLELIYRDCPYGELPDKINQLGPRAIISMHCNTFDGRTSGTETLYYHTSTAGMASAEIMQRHLVSALMLPDRGTKPRKEKDRGGHLLRHTKAPCIIVEPFFIDNDREYEIVRDNLDGLVRGYIEGIAGLNEEIK